MNLAIISYINDANDDIQSLVADLSEVLVQHGHGSSLDEKLDIKALIVVRPIQYSDNTVDLLEAELMDSMFIVIPTTEGEYVDS